MKYSIKQPFFTLICILLTFSCKKQDTWLNAKRSLSDVTPSTLQDFQAVLDNNQVMNGYGSIIGLIGTDNIYVPDDNLDGTDQTSRNAYLWAKDIYQQSLASDWLSDYQEVEYANIVLDGLANLSPNNQVLNYNNVKGSALFYRSFAFYQLAQLYCKPYVSNTASTDLGIPLRLSSDVNIRDTRASVQQTYTQILTDLKTASSLLPENPLYKTRPSTVAVNALLAKVYLAMSDYKNALYYASATLDENSSLLDFNTLTISPDDPFPTLQTGNPEVIFHAWCLGYALVWPNGNGRVSPFLYQAYDGSDLRKTAFFTPDPASGYNIFIGSYSANGYNFCGLATDEIYLVRSECFARTGDMLDALKDLNTLLAKRYSSGTFSPLTITDPTKLLTRIFLERQKEMPFTGNTRWEDLRRLNLESEFETSLTRTYHSVLYTLPANDPRFVLPLPDDEIQLEKVVQNPR
jgi:hypothetical protein